MNSLSLPCPACGEIPTTNLGQLRAKNGVVHLSDPGNLYRCLMCGLLFRRPYPSPLDLVEAYSELPANQWDYTQGRPDFDLAVSVIRNALPSGCILDVGCFRGDFLTMLPGDYQKYGIEPAGSAREIAQWRRITLIGSSIEQIEINRPMFHAITLLDVIEHLPYPLASLQELAKLLLPRGILILSTGNTDAIPWRLMQQDYWYYFPEHVSFFNPRWFRWAAKQLDLDLVLVRRFSHFKGSAIERWRQFARCLAFWVVKHHDRYPSLQQVICSVHPFSRVSQWSSPPMAHLWRDHMLVVLKSAS